jgi:hypothetical protein
MNDKTKKIIAYVGAGAILTLAGKVGYELGQYSNRPVSLVQRELNADKDPDYVILTPAKKYIFMDKGDANYHPLKTFMKDKEDEIWQQTADLK